MAAAPASRVSTARLATSAATGRAPRSDRQSAHPAADPLLLEQGDRQPDEGPEGYEEQQRQQASPRGDQPPAVCQDDDRERDRADSSSQQKQPGQAPAHEAKSPAKPDRVASEEAGGDCDHAGQGDHQRQEVQGPANDQDGVNAGCADRDQLSVGDSASAPNDRERQQDRDGTRGPQRDRGREEQRSIAAPAAPAPARASRTLSRSSGAVWDEPSTGRVELIDRAMPRTLSRFQVRRLGDP